MDPDFFTDYPPSSTESYRSGSGDGGDDGGGSGRGGDATDGSSTSSYNHPLDLQLLEQILPPGYTYILARGIPADQMPLLLQRAKIVLDLGELSLHTLYTMYCMLHVLCCGVTVR